MAVSGEPMRKTQDDVSLLQRPISYGDILGARGKLGETAVTPEDAALMQSAEARTFGKTQKDGTAAVMQAAAEENVRAGFVKPGDHSLVAEDGVVAQHILVPGAAIDLEYIAGQPVMESVKPMPTDGFIATSQAVTIGNALEGAALVGNRPVGKSDARAIQSAVMRATGAPPTAGGLAAAAMAAAEINARVPSVDKTTLADILTDASVKLDSDKIATQEDAAKVLNAESRGSPTGEPQFGGVAAALQVAANINDYAGLIDGHFRPVVPIKEATFPEQEQAVSAATENVPTAGGELHAKVD